MRRDYDRSRRWSGKGKKAKMIFAVFFTLFAFYASAIPQVTFPINAQIPPVARVSEFFNFQFSSSTFTSSDTSTLTFAIQGAPSWLDVESANRTFSGTPLQKNVGSFSFSLLATDGSGSTATEVTFIVVNTPGPQIVGSISTQLSTFGPLSSSNSIAMLTSTNFNFSFSNQTFEDDASLIYYAVSENRSPLPSWLNFNPKDLTFSGLTPPLITSPQTFGVSLIATDVEGFAGAMVDFALVISNHRLAFEPWQHTITVKDGSKISYGDLSQSLFLDGAPIPLPDIQNATANIPSWLSFDAATLAISGTAPPNTIWQNITVSAQDQYGDIATAELDFHFQSQVFVGQIGVLNATIGRPFNYTFGSAILAPHSDIININLGAAASWLHFNADSLEIYGNVPVGTTPGIIQSGITARSTTSGVTGTQAFEIRIVPIGTVVQTSRDPSMLGTSTAIVRPQDTSRTSAVPSSPPTSSTKLSNGDIAAAVIGPLLGLMALAAAVLCMLRSQSAMSRRQTPEERKRTIRGPIPQGLLVSQDEFTSDLERGDSEKDESASEENRRFETENFSHAQELGPSAYGHYEQNFLGMGETPLNEKFAGSPTEDDYLAGSSKVKASRYRNKASRSSKQEKDENRQSHKSSRRSSRQSRINEGLPVSNRLPGLGHGRGSFNSYNQSLGMWPLKERRRQSDSSGTPSTGILYEPTTSSYFPLPPPKSRRRTATSVTLLKDDKRQSIRAVVSTERLDARPIAEKRRSYIRKRASSTYNPFFAGDSRASSLSKRKHAAEKRGSRQISESHGLERGPSSGTRSFSQSSSVEPPARNPKRLDSYAYREHMASLFPRVVSEIPEAEAQSHDPWETVDNSSEYYSDSDNGDGYDKSFANDNTDSDASKPYKRADRGSRVQMSKTGNVAKERRPKPGTSVRMPITNATRGPKLVDITGRRPVSIEESNETQIHMEQSAVVGHAEYGSASSRGRNSDDGGAAFL